MSALLVAIATFSALLNASIAGSDNRTCSSPSKHSGATTVTESDACQSM